jgi:hypothetical protein
MSWPTCRRHPRSMSEAFEWERPFCIETPRGVRMSLPKPIHTDNTLLARLLRWMANWRRT